ncbi:unnamed protein product [Nyctereutes procyonoides]|uniref:(raccoon dog) hypothetical protein n=1 Tax=Nyctereutes procyonoides TaxID=34880 RepID=A0A811Z832_NYCPR|nr:unnamed protein product [Nyctereutes procyonoides]
MSGILCSSGSCYPLTGDLIGGCGQNLRASSTCGLHGPEPYCIESEKCFFCDSWNQGGHGIENVLSSGYGNRKTWWQAKSDEGVENVTIQLDLESTFYFIHLIMTFKHVYQYFAYNCSGLFPGIPLAPGHRVSDLVCDQHYSNIEPFTEDKVIFKVLDPAILVESPNNPNIQGNNPHSQSCILACQDSQILGGR